MNQQSYIEAMGKRFGLTNAKPKNIPMDPGLQLSDAQCPSTAEEKK